MCHDPPLVRDKLLGAPASVKLVYIAIMIQMQLRISFALIHNLLMWSPQNCVHDMTAVLSWHVQNYAMIQWAQLR